MGISDIGVDPMTKAKEAIGLISKATERISAERSKFGAYNNRLESALNYGEIYTENLTSAESRIRDVEMAKEMMNLQKNSILQQAAQAMRAQANQQLKAFSAYSHNRL